MKTHTYRRRLHFAETDAAGVAHFSKLAAFVEEAEHDFFWQAGLDPFSSDEGWPRLALHIEFLTPCRFGEEILVTLTDFQLGRATLTYQFSARLLVQEEARREIFRGTMKICHVRRAAGGTSPAWAADDIPPAVREALGLPSAEVQEDLHQTQI